MTGLRVARRVPTAAQADLVVAELPADLVVAELVADLVVAELLAVLVAAELLGKPEPAVVAQQGRRAKRPLALRGAPPAWLEQRALAEPIWAELLAVRPPQAWLAAVAPPDSPCAGRPPI